MENFNKLSIEEGIKLTFKAFSKGQFNQRKGSLVNLLFHIKTIQQEYNVALEAEEVLFNQGQETKDGLGFRKEAEVLAQAEAEVEVEVEAKVDKILEAERKFEAKNATLIEIMIEIYPKGIVQ